MTTARPDPTDAELERQLRGIRQHEDAPEHVIQRAFTVWRPRRDTALAPGLRARVMAVLGFDSAAGPALAMGVRTSGSRTRQLLFSAEGQDIDLRIGPADEAPAGRWVLSGQVLGPEARGSVALSDGAQTVAETTLDEFGEFSLAPVAPGSYWLALALDGREIVLPVLQVPQPD